MLKGIKNKSVLYKLLLSYFLIFVLPLIAMTGMLYKTAVVDVKKEIINSNLHKLNQLRDTVELRIRELDYLALKIRFNPRLTPSVMSGNEYRQFEGINQLDLYKSSNAFIDNLFVYYRGSDRIYSAEGFYSLDTWVKFIYKLDDSQSMELVNYISTLAEPSVKTDMESEESGGGGDKFVTYLYPIFHQKGEPTAVVMFLIPKENFYKMIRDMLGDLPGGMFVFDKDDNVVVSTDNRDFKYDGRDVETITNNKSPGIHAITLGNKEHTLINVTSDAANLTFVAAIQTPQLFKEATYMGTVILELALSLLTFGIFIILIISNKGYKPIKELMGYINLQDNWEDERKSMNEIDQISHTVINAINQNKNLKAQIDIQRPLIKEQILARLLQGEESDKDKLMDLMESTQINLSGPYYAVMVITKSADRGGRSSFIYEESVWIKIKQQFSMDGIAWPVELIQNNAIALIVSLQDSDTEKRKRRDLAGRVQEVIEEQSSEVAVIGVGKVVDSITLVNRSFIEAFAALEGGMIKSEERILFFDEVIKNEEQIYWYPAEDQLRFIQSLKQGDKAVALETLDIMIGNIAEQATSVLMAKYICFDIVNAIIKTVNEMDMNEFHNEIRSLMAFSSLNDFAGNLRIISVKFCECVNEKKRSENDELYKQILGYIHLRFDHFDLSLEGIAMELKLPVYYLSRFFKEKASCTFTDYITKLRMDRAKELLSSSQMSVRDIVNSVGYTDPSSFMRKFKKLEGITPGEYRQLNSTVKK